MFGVVFLEKCNIDHILFFSHLIKKRFSKDFRCSVEYELTGGELVYLWFLFLLLIMKETKMNRKYSIYIEKIFFFPFNNYKRYKQIGNKCVQSKRHEFIQSIYINTIHHHLVLPSKVNCCCYC